MTVSLYLGYITGLAVGRINPAPSPCSFRILAPMLRFVPALQMVFLLLAIAVPAGAAVEVAPDGLPPVTLNEVYLRDGIPYLALDDVLPALGLRGEWDAVRHLYVITAPQGKATLFAGSRYLNLENRYLPLAHPPRFIDRRLRVSEDFVTGPLSRLIGGRVFYRNLNPAEVPPERAEDASTLDRLFAFLLRKKGNQAGPSLRGVAIDPGHGGLDPGTVGGGLKEKDLNLDFAKDLEKQLKMQLGVPVFLSRDADYSLSLDDRLKVALHPEVDAFLQLHVQAESGAGPKGVMFFVRPFEESDGQMVPAGQGESLRLARELATELGKAGIPVTGIYSAPLLPLGRGNLPTVLVELGFLTNPDDRARLTDPTGRQALVAALFAGLKAFGEHPTEIPQ